MKKTMICVLVMFSFMMVSTGAFAGKAKPRKLPTVAKKDKYRSVERLRGRIEQLEKMVKEKDEEIARLKISSKYDMVPADKVPVLLMRLDLIREVLEKHGRAYDYRSTTSTELEDVLKMPKKKAVQSE